jgi:hypothetical protein
MKDPYSYKATNDYEITFDSLGWYWRSGPNKEWNGPYVCYTLRHARAEGVPEAAWEAYVEANGVGVLS